jgi:hypothetical protein
LLTKTELVVVEDADVLTMLGKDTGRLFRALHKETPLPSASPTASTSAKEGRRFRCIGFTSIVSRKLQSEVARYMYGPAHNFHLLTPLVKEAALVTSAASPQNGVRPMVVDVATADARSQGIINSSGAFATLTAFYICEVHEQFSAVFDLLKAEIAKDPLAKILVNCVNARVANFYTDVAKSLAMKGIIEFHGRKSPAGKIDSNEKFRSAKNGALMFTSDLRILVPDMTLVMQVGLHSDWSLWNLSMADRLLQGMMTMFVFFPKDHKAFLSQLVTSEMNRRRDGPRGGGVSTSEAAVVPASVVLPAPYPENNSVKWALGQMDSTKRHLVYQNLLTNWLNFTSRFKSTRAEVLAFAREFAVKGMLYKEPPGLHSEVIADFELEGVPGAVLDVNAPNPKAPVVSSLGGNMNAIRDGVAVNIISTGHKQHASGGKKRSGGGGGGGGGFRF